MALSKEKKQRLLELIESPDYQHHENDVCLNKNKCITGKPNYSKISKEMRCNKNTVQYHYDSEFRKKLNKKVDWRPARLDIKILELFNRNSSYTVEELSEKLDANPIFVEMELDSFERHMGKSSPIKEENGIYSMNQNSIYWGVTDGYWKD